MHLTWRFGSPDSQFARWLMIVSMAIAVLPVCRSPMISSRWPRPIGVIASMALIPVCSGSLTFWRCTTDGACSSRARSSVPSISPLPSSGTPSGSTTRPRNPSPTGTDSTSPVRRTCWPSSTLAKSPRMTTPISRTSRFSASPRIPPGNSSSSFAIAEGSPSTRAIPSPASATVPTSCLEASSGSYAWTKLARASRISSGRIVSSAMFLRPSFFFASLAGVRPWEGLPWSCRRRAIPQRGKLVLGNRANVVCSARCLRHGAHVLSYPHAACLRCPVPPERREAAVQRPVNEVIPDLNGHTTHDLGIDDDIQLNAAAVDGGQRRCQPFALAVTERGSDPHDCDQALPPLGDEPCVVRQVCFQATPPRVDHGLGDQPQGGRCHFAREQGIQQLALLLAAVSRAGQGGDQLGLAAGDPAEPEQFILDVVKLARTGGGRRRGENRKLLGGVGDIPGHRPVRAGQPGEHVEGGRADPLAEQIAHQAGAGRLRGGRIRERAAHGRLAVQQADDREQFVPDRGGHVPIGHRRGQPV